MPAFTYQAVATSGQRVRGREDAPSAAALTQALEARGLVVVEVAGGGAELLHRATEPHNLMPMRWEDYIAITPGVRSGKPCIVGTRITVYDILEYLAGGTTEAQLLEEFPSLRPEHIRAALAFAAARERRLANPPAA